MRIQHSIPFAACLAITAVAATAQAQDHANAATAPQVRTLLADKGYTRIGDLRFSRGLWRADATSADGNRVDLTLSADGQVVHADTQVATLGKDDIKAKLTAAGYSEVHDVDFKDGVWKAEAERENGKNVRIRVDADSGRILSVENE